MEIFLMFSFLRPQSIIAVLFHLLQPVLIRNLFEFFCLLIFITCFAWFIFQLIFSSSFFSDKRTVVSKHNLFWLLVFLLQFIHSLLTSKDLFFNLFHHFLSYNSVNAFMTDLLTNCQHHFDFFLLQQNRHP